jgi:hypothetical protein
MSLKQFMVNHVRHWEAALFQDLAGDWLLSDLSIKKICEHETKLVEMSKMSYNSRDPIAEKSKNSRREYLRCSDFLALI